MKFTIYTQEGKKAGDIDFSDILLKSSFKPALIKQVVLAFLANARTPVAHVKDRGAVRGGGKKPWKQKGTGRARHGSSRSPIWVGGGVTHGPSKFKNYGKKVNRKMAKAALVSALSAKAKDAEILMVDNLNIDTPSAKIAKSVLTALSKVEGFERLLTKKRNAALLLSADKDTIITKSFSNFGNVFVKDADNLNVYDVLKYKYIVMISPKAVEDKLLARLVIKNK